MSVSQKEANEVIAKKVAQIEKLISECEGIAKDAKVTFSIDLAYGMGGYYDGEDGEWHPSSTSC